MYPSFLGFWWGVTAQEETVTAVIYMFCQILDASCIVLVTSRWISLLKGPLDGCNFVDPCFVQVLSCDKLSPLVHHSAAEGYGVEYSINPVFKTSF